MTLARKLAKAELPFTLTIIAFGSEKLGLVGSRFYVSSLGDQELENTKAMLNFDALGTGSGVSEFGDGDITAAAAKCDEAGIEVAVTRGMRGGISGFAPFSEAGIPFMMFFGDRVPRIYTDSDTIDSVQPEMLGGAVVAAAVLLQSPEFEELIASQ